MQDIPTNPCCGSRNRLPSLYSDFTPQKKTNPDGYAVNVAAWEQALNRAAKRGYTSSRGVRVRSGSSVSATNNSAKRMKTDHLTLRTDESLLRDLESPEWGRPVALGTVFVCFSLTFGLKEVLFFKFDATEANIGLLGRSSAQECNDSPNDLQDYAWAFAEETSVEGD
jgi:hypothetical protein